MVFKKGDNTGGEVHTGTEAWNIAQFFTGFSIAVPLRELNELEDIARFGSLKMDEEILYTDDQYDKRRAEAIKRYWQKLRQIISDTMFKVKARDRDRAKELYENLKDYPKYFDRLLLLKTDNISHDDKLELNEDLLNKLLDRLTKIKEDYLPVLDHAGLIFKETDEVDLDKLMNEFVHGG